REVMADPRPERALLVVLEQCTQFCSRAWLRCCLEHRLGKLVEALDVRPSGSVLTPLALQRRQKCGQEEEVVALADEVDGRPHEGRPYEPRTSKLLRTETLDARGEPHHSGRLPLGLDARHLFDGAGGGDRLALE